MIGEWEQDGIAFQYEERGGKVKILQWKGSASEIRIPEEIQGKPVTEIGRKAFLSNKRICKVYFPEVIVEIGEWAFAYCSRLEMVEMPRKEIVFGKGAFLGCERLEQIQLQSQMDAMHEEKQIQIPDTISYLLAAAVHKLDAPYLLTPAEAGMTHWMEKWDARMLHVMTAPDREGYSKTILCGEEDYGSMENNLDYFLSQKRRSKVRLALLRLQWNDGLSEENRLFLEAYLKKYTKGCAFEETWLVVKEEYGNRKEYFDLLMEIGALTEGNFDAVISDMGAELAEMKAYLLRVKETQYGSNSFFDTLSL